VSQRSSLSVLQILDKLVEHGWIPLRSMAVLLGLREVRGIYQRQRGKNAIPVVQVGGTKRVYADVVVETLEKATPNKYRGDGTILSLYRDMLRRKQKEKEDR